jgi:uncharacterized damage-inducible protein DinB
MTRPASEEYAEYYRTYVSLVPEGDIGEILAAQIDDSIAQLESADAERERFRYAEGKWSVREAVGHVVETERMFTGRALWMARHPGIVLPGMDQDAWIVTGRHDERPLAGHLSEWRAVRASTIELLRGLPSSSLENRGIASGVTFSVRALFWIVAGHELHHRRLFAERYGLSDPAR